MQFPIPVLFSSSSSSFLSTKFESHGPDSDRQKRRAFGAFYVWETKRGFFLFLPLPLPTQSWLHVIYKEGSERSKKFFFWSSSGQEKGRVKAGRPIPSSYFEAAAAFFGGIGGMLQRIHRKLPAARVLLLDIST